MTVENRKMEEFEDHRKKWKIYFDMEPDTSGSEKTILARFRINRKDYSSLTEKEIEKLKNDLRDLGKLRIIKEGTGFLK